MKYSIYLGFFLFFSTSLNAQSFEDMSVVSNFNISGDNHGIAIGDFDQDGLDDIYVSRRGATNLLYHNNGNFVFEEISESMGVAGNGNTNASLWLDFDNDGDLDLFIGNTNEPTQLMRNDGGHFSDITMAMGIATTGNLRSLNATDYNNDGYLDIYIAYFNQSNVLWKNNKGNSFSNEIETAGIVDNGSSMAAIFFDFDLDGDADMYQVHDANQAYNFYINNGDGSFTQSASTLGLDYVGMGMGVDVGDINNDGYPDIYVTNLFENTLFLNNTNGSFDNVTSGSGTDDIGMGWGTMIFDADNDGWKDIYLANESPFGVNGISNIPNRLFINNGNLTFSHDVMVGGVQNDLSSYGASIGDLDGDGRNEILIANKGTVGNQLFKNTCPPANYITVALKGQTSNAQGIGASVIAYGINYTSVEIIKSGSGYVSQSSAKAHFGLGSLDRLDSLVILWPSGIRQVVENPAINQFHQITESSNFPQNTLIWTDPPFPTQLDDVTVYFNAKEGNGALEGFSGQVFAHTGVITSNSAHGADWQHVNGNWGTFDTQVLMSSEGDDVYSISYNIEDYYDINAGEEVYQMAFVFRSQDGSIVGRDTDGSDIYTDVFPPDQSLLATLLSPGNGDNIISSSDSILLGLQINVEADVVINDNDVEIYNGTNQMISFYIHPSSLGFHDLDITVSTVDDTVHIKSSYYVLDNNPVLMDPPVGTRDGLNYQTDGSYIFQLHAPGKTFAFLLCPFNEFRVHGEFQMNTSIDGSTFWIQLPRSNFENGNNTYQYLVNDASRFGDPYSTVVLDPWNDEGVDQQVMAELPAYPIDFTSGIVTAFDLDKPNFNWVENNFEKPSKTDLVIYELLMRDFTHEKNYEVLLDTLDYLQGMGINAIELMPIFEFEGNQSWGYNPSYHMAVDKYYGSRDGLKMVIDACHERGIAVILDVVFNHAFSLSPLAQMFWDATNFRPSENNPWLNVVARHPFNVGYDFNHESLATKRWVKQILTYWVEEFRFDGFRFDLSKGLTQKNSGSNAGIMAQYDSGRIAILKDYANHIWSLESDSYVILEHFADNSEETELANYGMMLWGNMTHDFGEAAMGYSSDLEWTDYKERGWNDPHLIAYMESHDEERMGYKIFNFGDDSGDYDTKELPTAMERIAAASALYFSIPGPKMLWQFGELGYDYSINRCVNGTINNDCRLDPKPIRWDYFENEDRKNLYAVINALAHLKTDYSTFETTDYNFEDGNFFVKRIQLNHPDMDALTLVNFRVIESQVVPKFQYPGLWYEYFSGDSIMVTDVDERIDFKPGEYRIYTSKRITPPNGYFTSSTNNVAFGEVEVYPNPLKTGSNLSYNIPSNEILKSVKLISLSGTELPMKVQDGQVIIQNNIPKGMYVLQMATTEMVYIARLVIQ